MRRVISLLAIRQHKALVLALALGVAGLFFGLGTQTASAACDPTNDIIYCGFSSPSNFISKVQANNDNGHHDLVNIYEAYGLEPSEYDRFVTSSQQGTVNKNGTLVVGGKTVASNVNSIGRRASAQGSGYFTQNIAGTNYYGNTNDKAFASNSLPATVLFNAEGQVEFAVINSCGNPIGAPSYSCNMLHSTAVSGQPGAYTFTTDASAGSTAKIAKYVYDFGDGTSATSTAANGATNHTYTANGNFTVKVTVYVNLPGNQTMTVTSSMCSTVLTVALPFYQCVQLAGATIDNSKYQYKFIVTGSAGNGATLSTADFDFGDTNHMTGVGFDGTTASATHTYTKDGTYNAVAVIYVKLPDGSIVTVKSSNCATKVPVAVPYYSCVQLTGSLVDQTKLSYTFTATASFGNGAKLNSVEFDFGDGNVTKGVVPSGTSASADHSYGASGNYTATAILHFSIGSDTQDVKCTAAVTPTQVTPQCRPGIPQGSPLCSPCSSNSSLPADSPQCTLPNTGAGDVIGVAGVMAVIGFFLYRQFIFKRRIVQTDGSVAAGAPTVHAEIEDDTLVQQVVSHHQNAHHPLRHPTYHRPHRFRPRSHHDQ